MTGCEGTDLFLWVGPVYYSFLAQRRRGKRRSSNGGVWYAGNFENEKGR